MINERKMDENEQIDLVSGGDVAILVLILYVRSGEGYGLALIPYVPSRWQGSTTLRITSSLVQICFGFGLVAVQKFGN